MRSLALLLLCLGCAAPAALPETSAAPPSTSLVLRNARLPSGATVSIRIADDVITHVGASVPPASRERDLGGSWIAPHVIDSHVHLEVLPAADALLAAGVAAVVDLGAPIESLSKRRAIGVVSAGPMITRRRGYPTLGWGRNGYGLEIDGADEARAAVDTLADAGAGLIKVALAGDRGLDAASLDAVVAAAHARGLTVAAHALSAADVALAAAADVDILAHTPLEPLDDTAAAAWSGRRVITTLAAFAPAVAADNLRRLIAAGATPIYGTDLGNTRDAGISRSEIEAMRAAGMSGADILTSMTTAPARLWGLEIGAIAAGFPGCLVVLDASPLERPETLAAPVEVISCRAGGR